MAITQISKIQVRTGSIADLPVLSPGEFGYATDTERLFIGNVGGTLPTDNTEILTSGSPIPAGGSDTQVLFNNSGSMDGSSDFTFDYFTNELSLGGNFVPTVDNTQSIGGLSYRWANIYATSLSTGASANAGTITGTWTLTSGSTFEATYSADLAEYYTSDEKYEPGTVLAFGGSEELTLPNNENYTKIAGVVSTNPALILNTAIADRGVMIALAGRTPVKVYGKIAKGDLLRASNLFPGFATVDGDGGVIGRAIQSYDSSDFGTIEVMVNRC
jgi:hypothetical protein